MLTAALTLILLSIRFDTAILYLSTRGTPAVVAIHHV
jgi:hypothetical protein